MLPDDTAPAAAPSPLSDAAVTEPRSDAPVVETPPAAPIPPAPPVDNDHIAEGASPFTGTPIPTLHLTDDQIKALAESEPEPGGQGLEPYPLELRVAALEAEFAFLRKQFGWPTKP